MNNEEEKRIQELENKYKNFDLNNQEKKENVEIPKKENISFEEFKKQKEISQEVERESIYEHDIYEREENSSKGIPLGTIILITIFSVFFIGIAAASFLGVFDNFGEKQIEKAREVQERTQESLGQMQELIYYDKKNREVIDNSSSQE